MTKAETAERGAAGWLEAHLTSCFAAKLTILKQSAVGPSKCYAMQECKDHMGSTRTTWGVQGPHGEYKDHVGSTRTTWGVPEAVGRVVQRCRVEAVHRADVEEPPQLLTDAEQGPFPLTRSRLPVPAYPFALTP